MKKRFRYITLFFSLLAFSAIAGEKPSVIPQLPSSEKLFFEENKNQWPSQVKFQVGIPGGSLFLEDNTFTYHLVENVDFHGFIRKRNDSTTVHHHAYKVRFENSNPTVQLSGIDPYSFVRNYYRGNDPSKWADNVSVFEGVKYSNIYSGIDILVYNSDKHLKYDFIISPGADPKNIQMVYEGPDEMRIDYGHLYIKTSVGVILEQKPYAYQEINGTKVEVACKYILAGNKLSFAIQGNYDNALPLIIDPTLVVATYTGSFADNWGFTATYDLAGNIYTGGIAAGNGYPTTVGAFQTTFGGGGSGGIGYPFDITISKLNPAGTALLFSTYYGGSDNEQPHSMFVNASNQLYVVGRTYSANFPTTAGAYDQTFNGGADIIIGKFNSTGGLLASTYVGGSSDDCVNFSASSFGYGGTKFSYADDGRSEIMLDNASNVYVAACTKSADFPTTASAYDATLNGTQDGCVIKLNSSLAALTFSTYLGGSSDDAAFGLKIDTPGNVYVTGGTTSNDFPTTAGVLHAAYMGGSADGFISVLNSTGTSLVSSTYIGTAGFDQSYFLENDASNNIYVFGLTTGAYPVTAGVYTNANSAQFIHKLNSSLTTTIFSTVIGTGSLNPNISPTAFLVDSCESIYLAGWGRCSAFFTPNSNTVTGMPITANAQQSTTDGCDFYFMVLTPNAKSLWYGTFYGENTGTEPDHVDGGTSRFDSRAVIYQSVCASCGSNNAFPTTPGALSNNNNSSNCNNAIIKMDVKVKPVAIANLTGPNSGCVPFTVPFNTTGSVASYYIWNVGDGSPSYTVTSTSHTYTAVGTYTVTLYAIDSLGVCVFKDSSKLVINVNPLPTASVVPSGILCLGQNTTLTASGGGTYSWNTGLASNVLTGVANGTYTVTVTNSFNCSAIATGTVNQSPLLTSSVTLNYTPCSANLASATVNHSGGASPYTYSWSNAETTQSVTGLNTGNYTVTVTDGNGCTSVSTQSVTIYPMVIAGYSVTTVCLGTPTQFTDMSNAATTSWSWNFGDGNTSVQQSPSHTYSSAGTYSATLTSTGAGGCNSVITHLVIVHPQPIADFGVITVCLGNPTQFTDLSTGGATQWSWNFGDGNTSTQQSPSNTYSAAGTYTATLIATGVGGCNSTISKVVTVYPQPIASFTATTECLGNPTQFTDLSTGGGTIWSWNFGDGNTSTQQNPSNTYTASGTYSVTLNASVVGGCNSNFTLVVTVNPQPVANYSVTTVCLGLPTQFTDLTTGGATQWSWNFGDGNTSTQQNPSNTYTAAGSYTATLTSTGPGGCNSVISYQIDIFALSVANFSVADICINTNPAVFIDQSTGAAQWTWNFGDGTPNSSLQSPTHIYGAPGTYTVSLVVQSGGACIDSIKHIINVNPVPDAIFTSSIVCFNNPTQFTDQSLGAPTQWFWDFGDGNTSTSQNPSHTYSTPGTFTVTLVVTNPLGCSDTLPLTALVNPLPAANFIAPTVCIGTITCFKDTTTITSGVITGWSWNFNDPNSGANNISNMQHPCHLFSAVGTYNVILTTTSNNGCQSTINLPVNVTLPPVASFTATSVCLNSPTFFTNQSTGSIGWNWNFGDGGTSTLQNPSHVYLSYGSYVVTLISSSGGLCSDTAYDTITVSPLPVVIFTSDSVCVGEQTSFTDLSFLPAGNITGWSWLFGDPASGVNNTSILQNPTHIFSSAGTYSVNLTVTSAAGCVNSKVFSVLVYPGPKAEFTFSPASPINLTDVVSFSDQSTGSPVQWWWNFDDGDTSVAQNPNHLFPDIGTYSITLIVVTQNGCADTIVHPLEILQFSFYIPNAFTPGGDGKNDFFFGKGVGIVEYELIIFDRWGNQIFYCNIKDLPQTLPCMWDGKVEAGGSNEQVQQDVYVWKVKLLDIFGESHKYIGTVTVVK